MFSGGPRRKYVSVEECSSSGYLFDSWDFTGVLSQIKMFVVYCVVNVFYIIPGICVFNF